MIRRVAYLDASAIVKLVTRERETGGLRRFIHGRPNLASSAIARTEVVLSIRHLGPAALRRARMVLGRVRLIRVDNPLLEAAAFLDPMTLRTLDAIHLATVLSFADDLDAVITYDTRMRAAADALGLPVVAPV